MELPRPGIGISDMLNAMAHAQQPIFTVPAYGVEYTQYPQYVTQHGAYITTTAPHAVIATHAPHIPSPYEAYAEDHGRLVDHARVRERERRERSPDRREHSKDRDRDRDRDHRDRRDRDRDRDRDRERRERRDRDRYRDEDKERSPRREREHHNHHRERESSRDRERDGRLESTHHEENRGGHDYKSMPPNSTIMVRGLAHHITENDIRADILACDLMPKDIRLVRKKESGASRGFAFIEFTTVHDATRWMEAKQGILLLHDAHRAYMQYSIPKDATDRQLKQSQDWFCVRCGAHNFKRRDSCFKCSSPRCESEAGEDGTDEVCTYPTNTLLFRGLDVLTTEESVLQTIHPHSSDLPMRSIRIGRDPLTNMSRGVCYVELNSVLDSMVLFNKINGSSPIIDGRKVTVHYFKLSQNSSGATNNHSLQSMEYTAGADIEKLAEYSASVYAQTPEEHTAYVEYYTNYYQQQAQAYQQGSNQSDSVNAAAAVAQSALQAVQQKSGANSASASTYPNTSVYTATTQSTETVATVPESTEMEYTKYPTPDVSQYKYDETSGYYYDPSTGLYYDANSTYYYNSETGSYLYWDAEKSTYLPASFGEETAGDGSADSKRDKKEKKDEKQEKVKVAKKIAKDMERWAKAQNKKMEVVKIGPEPISFANEGAPAGGGAADAAFAVLLERRDRSIPEKPQTFQMQLKKDSTPVLTSGASAGLVAAYGEGSESEEEKDSAPPGPNVDDDEKLVDLAKLACLLCKRQFPSKESLNKHVQMSSLHKTNLEALAQKRSEEDSSLPSYRDRAKERRQKYGQPNAPPVNRLKERYMAAREEAAASQYEEPNKEGISADNIGSRLLKKMGWSDGMGLGRSNQGRTDIIVAENRVASAGLGMSGSSYRDAGDSYKDSVRKMMFHRYKELDAIEKKN